MRIKVASVGLVLLAACCAGAAAPATAVSFKQAVDSCKAKARPGVRDCVRGKMMASGTFEPKKYIAGCRAKAKPAVRACVMAKMRSAK